MTSKIEWTDETWNPVTGCTPISEGCANCYAKRMATRLKGRFGYPADDPFRVTFHPDRLEDPLHWKKPRRIFVCSMGDLFHEDVKTDDIYRIIVRMEEAKQHTFLILTKRPKRMLELMNNPKWFAANPNLWLGVTAENQARFNERWLIAQQIPAAKLFVSMEPLLGPIRFLWNARKPDLIIAGCESINGKPGRKTEYHWLRDIKDQCVEAGIPFFLKQMAYHEWGKGYRIFKMPMLDGQRWDQLPG